MKTRNLTLLRIDDNIDDADRQQPAPATVDAFRLQRSGNRPPVDAINSWRSAQEIWAACQSMRPPDLVVADVLFEKDMTTPLRHVAPWDKYAVPIPTGLCHLKPFAALASLRGCLLGVGIHTGNAKMWRAACDGRHAMGLLAAHEIAEIAAILGEPVVDDAASEACVLDRCWTWLEERSVTNFYHAFKIAVRDYRKKVVQGARVPAKGEPPRVIVPATEWINLAKWAEQQSKDPKAIGTERAIDFLLPDGRIDRVSLASLFSDVENIATRLLPRECFGAEAPENHRQDGLPAWSLDVSGRPQIGWFIHNLRNTADVIHEAKRVLDQFPLTSRGGASGRLKHVVQGIRDSELVAGMAVLFQVVQFEKYKCDAWEVYLDENGWDPKEFRVCQEKAGLTLRGVLDRLRNIVIQEEDSFYPDEIVKKYNWPDPDTPFKGNSSDHWVDWHFQLLVAAGVLKIQGSEYEVANKSRNIAYPPPAFLSDFATHLDHPDLKGALQESFGYAKNDHEIGRILAQAFTAEKDGKFGREFLDRILDGEAPPWILRELRAFALSLGWKEWRMWPAWLRHPEGEFPPAPRTSSPNVRVY